MNTRIPAAPVLDTGAAVDRIDRLRAAGASSIALATGAFEILLARHARYLAGAAECADLLVVGVLGDRAVATLRGGGRALLGGEDRAAMVAGLACVDLVTIYEDADVVGLAHLLRPDVLCLRERGDSGAFTDRANGESRERGRHPWREVAIPMADGPETDDLLARIDEIEP